MPEMREKRYLGAAVVDANDNMWVLGGYEVYSESDLSKSTEVFEYYPPPRKGRWRRGSPLPSALRDSGLESHCAINLNKTHVFIAGGFAKAYYFQDNAADKIQRNKLDPLGDGIDLVNQGRAKPRRGRRQAGIGGGYSLKSAWIYDGNHWNRISDLQVPRDRPACSVMTKEDGSIRILVTEGCEGWCVKNPAMTLTEMYNPETNLWTTVADLPVPLNRFFQQPDFLVYNSVLAEGYG